MYTAKKFAEFAGIPYRTLIDWLQAGLVPGASLIKVGDASIWQIPGDAADKIERPQQGRPKGKKGK